jgi:hypothetical protein
MDGSTLHVVLCTLSGGKDGVVDSAVMQTALSHIRRLHYLVAADGQAEVLMFSLLVFLNVYSPLLLPSTLFPGLVPCWLGW